ncbi:MAG: (d)CMP kinase, partial [Planctomycetes bacterium]|nr:(d)CMP kinase [Planctomycetota bacterium]
TAVIRYAADNEQVRHELIDRQREFAREHDLVTEGRDQGTLVFPGAECKIFLVASPEERARRRAADLQARGEAVLLEEVLDQQRHRDEQDYRRELGRLAKAPDAVEVVTDGMSPEQVVDRLEQIVRARLSDFL